MILDYLINVAVTIARIAEHHIMSLYRLHLAGHDTGIVDVTGHGLVGRADREAEFALMESISWLINGLVTATGEESYATVAEYLNIISQAKNDSDYLLIFDPVDGTRGFNDKTGTFGTMATLLKRNKEIGKFGDYAAWIYNPNTLEMLFGDIENGVWQGKLAAVAGTNRFGMTGLHAVPPMATCKTGKTIMIDTYEFDDKYKPQMNEFTRLLRAQNFNVTETTQFCHLAFTNLLLNPDIVGYVRAPIKAHDVQPGITLLRAQGGVVTTFANNNYDIEKVIGGMLAGTDAATQQIIYACFKQAFAGIDYANITLAKAGTELATHLPALDQPLTPH